MSEPDDEEPYCRHCGSEDLACGELYASGREWECRQCGNIFQCAAREAARTIGDER